MGSQEFIEIGWMRGDERPEKQIMEEKELMMEVVREELRTKYQMRSEYQRLVKKGTIKEERNDEDIIEKKRVKREYQELVWKGIINPELDEFERLLKESEEAKKKSETVPGDTGNLPKK